MPRECGAPAAAPHLSAPSLSTHDTPSRHRSCPHAYPAPAVAAHWSAPSLTAHAGGPAGAPQQEAQQAALLDDDESFTNDEKGRRRRIERSLSQRSLDYLYLMREDAFGFQHCAHEKCLSITSLHSRVPASTRVSTRVAARSRTHPQTPRLVLLLQHAPHSLAHAPQTTLRHRPNGCSFRHPRPRSPRCPTHRAATARRSPPPPSRPPSSSHARTADHTPHPRRRRPHRRCPSNHR
jgi:hypothetical protein